MAHRTSSSVGCGFRSSSAAPTSIIPGVQNPHWRPCSSLNAAWIGWRPPSPVSPSTVVTSAPSAWTANIVQDFTGVPSTSTVHAPQPDVSHPTWVPVSPSVSRRKCTSSSLGSTSAGRSVPFTLTVICMSPTPSRRRGGGIRQSPPHEDLDDVLLVRRSAPNVGDRLSRRRGQPPGLGEGLLGGLRAGQGGLGLGRSEVSRAHRGEADPRRPDVAVVHPNLDGHP